MSLSLISNMAGGGVFAARHRDSHPGSSLLSTRTGTHVARARKGLSSRSRRLENRDKKGGGVATVNDAAAEVAGAGIAPGDSPGGVSVGGGVEGFEYSTTPMPALPGEEDDFWEGPQWNALGFFVQYQWAFGIVFALIACGIAVATYNEGATDFRQTPVYKESIQSRELLEEPEATNTDVFEANPTEVAPSLE